MQIKVHLTGLAVAYDGTARPKKPDSVPNPGRYQGSLYSQQKHAIANSIEWMRLNATYKPRIFVATTPGFLDHSQEGKFIQKLTHNLRNGYDMQHYCWVREFTGNGYPHFHFVADVDKFDPVKLSLYWSSLFDSDAKNSIRVGTRPNKFGKRKYWIDNPRMAWYMSKYIGKSMGDSESGVKTRFRTFAISQEARKASEPLLYQGKLYNGYNGLIQRSFELHPDQVDEGQKMTVNPHEFDWKWTGHNNTFVGFDRKRRGKH